MAERLRITRTFDAPRERVWDAFTTPEDFSVWFGTEAQSVPLETISMDVRPGGEWRAEMHIAGGGGVMHWIGEYTEVDRPARVAFTITDEPENPARDLVTVTLDEGDGAGTEMTLTQGAQDFTDEQLAALSAGYQAFMDSMERIVTPQA